MISTQVRAVDALNGDLLLGHILGAHIGDLAFEASIGFSADERRLGYTPSRNANSPPVSEVLAAIDAAAEELDDDPRGLTPGKVTRTGDDTLQINALIGYRFNRNQSEISVGVLNIGDQDYRFSPLSPYGNIARERTAVINYRINF